MKRLLFRRAAMLAGALLGAAVCASAAHAATYVVLYKQAAVPSDAKARVTQAGGTVIASYPQIGVVIASSGNSSFRTSLLADAAIEGAVSTARFGVKIEAGLNQLATAPPISTSSAGDPLSDLQWDMRQVHAFEAHAITGGDRSILVGDLDSGVDATHPDIAPNLDAAASASCLSGAPDQDPAAWVDDVGHGTHTAGTIAAAASASRPTSASPL